MKRPLFCLFGIGFEKSVRLTKNAEKVGRGEGAFYVLVCPQCGYIWSCISTEAHLCCCPLQHERMCAVSNQHFHYSLRRKSLILGTIENFSIWSFFLKPVTYVPGPDWALEHSFRQCDLAALTGLPDPPCAISSGGVQPYTSFPRPHAHRVPVRTLHTEGTEWTEY